MLDLLRKLGIVRWGATAGTYTSGKDRPAELLMDDVYDAKKDLVGGKAGQVVAAGVKHCPQCGAEVKDVGKFCVNCGAALAPQKRKRARWKKIALGAVVFVTLVIGLALYLTAPLVVPIERQLEALRRGDIDGAYAQTAQAFRQATSKQAFSAFLRTNPALTEAADISIAERSWENDNGNVRGSLKTQDGGVVPVEFRLVREGGEWKILGIQLPKQGVANE